MRLSGTLQSNLESAILSARRHQGKRVYSDTLAYWTDLIAYTWRHIGTVSTTGASVLTALVVELELEIAARS